MGYYNNVTGRYIWNISSIFFFSLFLHNSDTSYQYPHIDGLMQKRRNSSKLAMELHLFCIKPYVN